MKTFFDDLLGAHWGTQVRVEPSSRDDYSICVFAGDKPDPQRRPVLHLDLERRIGFHDAHVHWEFQANDSERPGHAWDDNAPDAPAAPYPFKPWVRDKIRDLIAGLAAERLDGLVKQVTSKHGKSPGDWRDLQASLQELHDFEAQHRVDRHGSLQDGWQCGLALAFCHLRAGDRDRGRFLLEEAGLNLSWTALLDARFRWILARTLPECEESWLQALSDPFDQLARLDRSSSQDEVTRWLASLHRPQLVRRWVDFLVGQVTVADRLATFAARLIEPSLAPFAVRLVEQAIALAGETPTLLSLLSGALLGAGEVERAQALLERLETEPSTGDVQGKIDEYIRRQNAISARQRRDGRIALSERDRVARVLQLENELNAFWLRRPASCRSQDCRDHRFVSGGSLSWISMFRDARDYAPAVEQLARVAADWPLFLLRFKSGQPTVEALINNGLGACLDSKQPEPLALAVDLVTRCLAELPSPDLADLHWSYACVWARSGNKERAFEHIALALAAGLAADGLREDTDLDNLRDDPRFKELLG